MKKRKYIYHELNFRKKYRRLQFFTILLLFFAFGLIYINYDYLVFKFLISYNYAYTDVLDEIYEETIGAENVKSYFRNFDSTVIALYSTKLREVGNDRYTFLYTPRQYSFFKEFTREEAKEIYIEELTEDTVYIHIPNMSKYTQTFISKHVNLIEGYNNLLIDLRDNSGGRLSAMYHIADLFLEKGAVIGYEKTRNPITSSRAKSTSRLQLQYENIYILVNENTASAAEGLTMALKENLDNVTIIGSHTFGKGVGQITLPLKHGFAVKATIMETRTPKDNTVNRVGITPDIAYDGDDMKNFILNSLLK